MIRTPKTRRVITTVAVASAAVLTLSACGGAAAAGTASSRPPTVQLWDAFVSDTSTPYGQLISTCQIKTGVRVERTTSPDAAADLLKAAPADRPQLAVLDNGLVAQFAGEGVLLDNETSGLDSTRQAQNILAASKTGGKSYGVSIGANTLALFYNKRLLADAGVQPPTDWAELKAAVAAATRESVTGISFSAVDTEEGSFQFEPFLWGAGADLSHLDSPQAVEALTLWTDWVKSGQAPRSVLEAGQHDVLTQFLAGSTAMMVNGTWQLPELDKSGIDYGVVPIPGVDGGSAPSPLGGEFLTVVKSTDTVAEKKAVEFAQCFVDPTNMAAWTKGQRYISPYSAQAEEQAAADPALVPWVQAVAAARGRTADLGSKYPVTSEALWTAVHEAVSGSTTPEQALSKAAASVAG